MADKTFGSSAGLTILAEDTTTPANGMVAHVTSSWNSGYQNGDIKGAFLSDTDDTDLVGGDVVSGSWATVSSYDNVTSGTGSSVTVTAGTTASRSALDITTVVGQAYVVSVTLDSVSAGTVTAYAKAGPAGGSSTLGQSSALSAGDTGTLTFVATATTSSVLLVNGTAASSFACSGVAAELADADRSVNNNGLIVNGTITRTFVDEV